MNALVRAYRLGQQFLLRQAFDASVSLPADDAVRATAYDRIVTDVFDYIDWMSQGVVAVYEEERESWLANRSNARDAKVRRLLSSDDDDIDAAERTIGYRLRGHHVAVVAWVNEAGAAQDQLSRFTRAIGLLAARIGATAPPLVIGRDRASAWGWIPVASDRRWDPSLVGWTPGAPEDHPVPRLALGGAHSGLPGFRRSHEEALQVHHLGGQQSRATRSVLSYDEPGVGVVALLAQNLETTRTWVRRVLGDLAVDDDQHERQRQTLLTFLQHDGSYTATADTMVMHKNSIKYRVTSAEKMLGHKVTEDRLAIELALLTCHWLGPAVLI